jgi:hypothetical protein
VVANDRMTLLEVLSKAGLSGDVDFLREGCQHRPRAPHKQRREIP